MDTLGTVALAAAPGQRYKHGWIPITPGAGAGGKKNTPAAAGVGDTRDALASAQEAIKAGDRAAAVNHLTKAMNAAMSPAQKAAIKEQRDRLAAKLMGKKPPAKKKPAARKKVTLAYGVRGEDGPELVNLSPTARVVSLAATAKLGSGARFEALVAKLKSRGYTDEQARKIAAKIGQRKYGAKKMGALAARGTKAANMAAPAGRGVDLAVPWDSSKHPRGKTGTSSGGKFVPLSYNAEKNSGTGYHHPGGGRRVKAVQTALNALGVRDKNGKALAVDGKYGPLTTSAIVAFQKRHGLPATGVVDKATMAAVLRRHRATAKTGSSGPKKKLKGLGTS